MLESPLYCHIFQAKLSASDTSRIVKKLMRPADGSISIDRPNAPDNKLIDCGKYLVLDSIGITARCPCLDNGVPDENAPGILAAHVLSKTHPLGSALTKLPLSPILPSVRLVVAIPQYSAYGQGRCPPQAFYTASISRCAGPAQVPSAVHATHSDETGSQRPLSGTDPHHR